MDELAIVIRGITILFASSVAGFCLSYMRLVSGLRQKARFAGLCLLSATFVWGTIDHMQDPFFIRLPIYTLAFTISLYGVLGMFKEK